MKCYCVRCGIEYEKDGRRNSAYCPDCGPLHRLEKNRRLARESWAGRHKSARPKSDGMSIEDVLHLTASFGLADYEYGKASVMMHG